MSFGGGVRAIETRYKNRRFRSRLEARWAVFFDAVGIVWEYEVEGFELPSGRYLPDFWLPQQKCWVEIKGTDATKSERALANELAAASKHDVYLFDSPFTLDPRLNMSTVPESQAYFAEGGGDWPYLWCECPQCGGVGIRFDGRSDRLPCKRKERHPCPTSDHGDKGYNSDSPRLMAAYARALSARFEFGEEG